MKSGKIYGWDKTDWGKTVSVDKDIDDVNPADYDALVLPGGQINPDLLRVEKGVIDFIKAFHDSGKPLAAICHAPWLLIEAGVVKGRRATSYKSIVTDMKNAGAHPRTPPRSGCSITISARSSGQPVPVDPKPPAPRAVEPE
jgi:protease I